MPVIGPGIEKDDVRVEEAFAFIMGYLETGYNVQRLPTNSVMWQALRSERNEEFKRALWKLFELESWESF